jgi:hypothetical protein
MARFKIVVRETRYQDYWVTADTPEQARAIYERSEADDATLDEIGLVEPWDSERTDWDIEEVIEY